MSAKPKERKRLPAHRWGKTEIEPGSSGAASFDFTESYCGLTIQIPVFVVRAATDGPSVFVTAAIHGDEINGTGAIRSLILDKLVQLKRGTLILVPVVNILGFDRHSRYLPDRRDLNRCFPGSETGSLARRMAHIIFQQIVARCDYGIDLHTAALRRTNFPNVRADLSNPAVAQIARAFGCELILNGPGPVGSFRREATEAGCATIVLEAGEVWKVEPTVVRYAVNGVISVLRSLDMVDSTPRTPTCQIQIEKTKWIRAERGGFLRFHISPGEMVAKGDPLATNTSLIGGEHNVLYAPFDAIVIGMTTLPSISPGDPVCNLGMIDAEDHELKKIKNRLLKNPIHGQMKDDLSTNVTKVSRDSIAS